MRNNLTVLIAYILLNTQSASAQDILTGDFPLEKKPAYTGSAMQSLKVQTYSPPNAPDAIPSKKFFFSAAVTPDFDVSVPPVSLSFERGIAKLASLGSSIGFTYDNVKSSEYRTGTVLIGLRACGYAFPALSLLSHKNVNSFGFDPYIGITYDYYIVANSADEEAFTDSQAGFVGGTRWYPGNKRGFGILAEYGTSGPTGANVKLGITLGR